ncbi:MAG TPA: DALR anticodon-binding domain-containing protein [Streptomyces sp.]|uniref:ArgS-related anticodon-binding protein NrtL n=1 Tax=Streptomyces sp. TaxID=1931 RepID=UPI002C3120FD|nr:DALR anticodon-binding domain-containing protein [Streptomyces sp.]HWU06293.1 DALR anticodon-binding domain-containing protein [Streptomyces sp.]
MTPADLSRTVLRAVRRAVDEDVLRAPVPERVRVERTRPGGSGDYACAVALQLAGPAALPAREVAALLRDRVAGAPGIGGVEITGAGFLNFTLDAASDGAARSARVRQALEQGLRYGWGAECAGQVHQLHHRHEVRAAVVAGVVGKLLRAQGALVRTTCEEVPDPAWARLGVTVDAHGRPPVPLARIRPVPAGATAGELLGRLGADAARWGLLRPAGHDRAAPGDELLVQGEGNPLFLVRYAHARARALARGGALLGLTGAYEQDVDAPVLHAAIADHPGVLAAAARHRAPDRLARHLETVAHTFFDFHDTCPPLPVGDEKPSAAHRSRLALAEAAGTVLAGGLSLLGISAPEHL